MNVLPSDDGVTSGRVNVQDMQHRQDDQRTGQTTDQTTDSGATVGLCAFLEVDDATGLATGDAFCFPGPIGCRCSLEKGVCIRERGGCCVYV
jgi:hypothetical protein